MASVEKSRPFRVNPRSVLTWRSLSAVSEMIEPVGDLLGLSSSRIGDRSATGALMEAMRRSHYRHPVTTARLAAAMLALALRR
jgi:hypothetical protein